MAGDGWTCAANICTRSDSLPGGSHYPVIVATVNVVPNANWASNAATVSGGGSISLTANDVTAVNPNPPILSVTKTHAGNFIQGQHNAAYTITVANQPGRNPTSGQIQVTETLPSGMTLVSIAGDGWTCNSEYAPYCNRSDPLTASATYPPITVTVNVAVNASSPLINSATVRQATGETVTVNDSTIIAPHEPAITLQSNPAGAPFSLEDGTVYQAPQTFYWPAGAQHTVTWLDAVSNTSNARYSFQNWTDGGSNPRTFTVSGPATYLANLGAQYRLTVTLSNPGDGYVTVNPASADGFYANGQVVTLTALASAGFAFQSFTGDVVGYSPSLSVTMNAPRSEVVVFRCEVNTYSSIPTVLGPGARSGMYIFKTPAGCGGSLTSSIDWFTVGPTSQQGDYYTIPYSLAANAGDLRYATLAYQARDTPGLQWQYTQEGVTSTRSNVVSVSPTNGTGTNQVFTLEAYHPSGFEQITRIYLRVVGTDQLSCNVTAMNIGAGGTVSLDSDLGEPQYVTLPGDATLQNSRCAVSGAESSVAGSGKSVTVRLSLSFTPAFSGSRFVTAGTEGSSGGVGTWTVPPNPAAPTLILVKKHSGSFTVGQTNVTYTVTVSNQPGSQTTSGPVTVTEVPPTGLSLVSMAGAGWTCSGNTCTRDDALAAGNSYPAITVTGNVASNAPSPLLNAVTVSGGGSVTFGASDSTVVVGAPTLTAYVGHTGDFPAGQPDATYRITVGNRIDKLPTSGLVTVTESLPPGLTLVSMRGYGWTCDGPTCSRIDALATGKYFPVIVVTVGVSQNAPSPLVNQVTVSGGGSLDAVASDSTVIIANPPRLSIAATHTGDFYQGQSSVAYSVTVSNQPGAATSGLLTVTLTFPAGMRLTSAEGVGWTCASVACSRSDPLPGGSSYPSIELKVDISWDAASPNVMTARLAGSGFAPASASDSATIIPKAVLSVAVSHTGSFRQGQDATYTVVVSNQAGKGPYLGSADVTDTLPAGMSMVSMSGNGWNCHVYSAGGGCSRTGETLSGGSSYPSITVTVALSPTAASPLVNSVRLAWYDAYSAYVTATDSTTILPHEPAVTFQSNLTGAPFSLEDGTVYRAPYTFYWSAGAHHTVTWLTAAPDQPGARYSFQNWSDGGTNPRTFTITGPATYSANLSAQYQLTLINSTPAGGTVDVIPPSNDSFYSKDQTVVVTAHPGPGYTFHAFSGDGNFSPATVTMDGPRTMTAQFVCSYTTRGTEVSLRGPGPQSGIFIWSAGAGCTAELSTDASWLTVGSAAVESGFHVVPYSAPENTGAGRSATLSFAGSQVSVQQDAAGSPTPTIVSLSPNRGSGPNQVFTLQAYHSGGYAQISRLDLIVSPPDGANCYATVTSIGGVASLYLVNDAGIFAGPLVLPGSGALQNSHCSLSAAGSSVSGSDKILTANFALAFTPAFTGGKYISALAPDPTQNSVWPATLGTWTVAGFPFSCDVNGDQLTNVVDVQLAINEALGTALPLHDLNHDGDVNVADVQKLVNAALGLGCPY